MVICNTYTVAGHTPRSSKHSAFTNHVDIVYNVFKSSEQDKSVPREDRVNFLLLHGSQLSKEVWNYYAELLFKHYGNKLDRVIAADALNSGDSAYINGDRIGWYHTWDDLARDHVKVVEDVIRREGLPGPLFAMGHSMGGAETLFLVNQAPALFAGAIALDPVWGADNVFAVPEALPIVAKILNGVHRKAQSEFADKEAYDKFIDSGFICGTFHPRIKEDVRKYAAVERNGKYYLKATPEQQAGAYGGCVTVANHSITTFSYTSLPVCVAYGENEDWNPPGSNDDLAQQLPNGETVVIKDGGHLVFYEKPEQTLEAIYPFVDRVAAEYIKNRVTANPHDTKASFKEWLGKLKGGIAKL